MDYRAGMEIAFSIFYLIPVASTAWIDGKGAGIFVFFMCSAVWSAADLAAGREYMPSWILWGNMAVRTFFSAIILARLRTALNRGNGVLPSLSGPIPV